MSQFSYRGRDQAGELVKGTIEAASADAVASQLGGRGVIPIAIAEQQESKSIELGDFFEKKITLEELIMFSRQMHSLSRAGVVLNSAIRGMAQSTKNPRLERVLSEVEISLNTGVTLSASLKKHPDVFDELYVNLVQVGENTGRLDLAFQQLAQYLALEKDTRRRVMTAIRYPMFVFAAIAVAIVILNIFVIPVFADLFSKFGAELPLATKILIGSSNLFLNYWPWLLASLVLVIFGIRYYLNTDEGATQWDKYKLRLPLIGGILQRAMLARFGRSFSMMLTAGVPLINALQLCSQAVGNRWLGLKIDGMKSGIQRGESLLKTSKQSEMFTPLVLQMIQVGEETGQVDELLAEVALFYEEEVDYDLKNLSSYIEPLLIACIAGIVMVLALGIFLPMWDMFSVMQR